MLSDPPTSDPPARLTSRTFEQDPYIFVRLPLIDYVTDECSWLVIAPAPQNVPLPFRVALLFDYPRSRSLPDPPESDDSHGEGDESHESGDEGDESHEGGDEGYLEVLD